MTRASLTFLPWLVNFSMIIDLGRGYYEVLVLLFLFTFLFIYYFKLYSH
jgi:hypothetical protein